MEEIFPLVDEQGNVIGQALRSRCHDGSKLLHPVVHLHIFNTKGELFLQKRSSTKDIQPGMWDTSSAGHIGLNETPIKAVLREVSEELGITGIAPHFITRYIIETNIERELSYCFYTVYDGDIKIDNDEVSDGCFWTIDNIKKQLGKGIFTLNFESDFLRFFNQGLSCVDRLHWKVDNYNGLDKESLYRILDIRNKVFMLEQKVECPDLDYKDQQAIHLQAYTDEKLVAYCRIFLPVKDCGYASVGRVAVEHAYRALGYGRLLMEKAMEIIGNFPVEISAQLYLENFYTNLGFVSLGKPYIEAGIPHIRMRKE